MSRWTGSAECCDCRAGREMSRQPLSSSLMPVQVRNVFIAECTVCVCAHECLGKFQRQSRMHLNYTPVWSCSPAQELKSCKESTEVKTTIWFPSPEGHSSISPSVNSRGLKPWQGSQPPDAGRGFFVKGDFIAAGLKLQFCLTLQKQERSAQAAGFSPLYVSWG